VPLLLFSQPISLKDMIEHALNLGEYTTFSGIMRMKAKQVRAGRHGDVQTRARSVVTCRYMHARGVSLHVVTCTRARGVSLHVVTCTRAECRGRASESCTRAMARLIASCAPLWDLMECAAVGSVPLWGLRRCGDCGAVGSHDVRRCGISGTHAASFPG
jgi:hypothetical protein